MYCALRYKQTARVVLRRLTSLPCVLVASCRRLCQLVAVAEWLARPTAAREDPGSNHTADGCVYRDGHCDMQPWARAAHLYCSAYVNSAKLGASLRNANSRRIRSTMLTPTEAAIVHNSSKCRPPSRSPAFTPPLAVV